MNKIELNLTGKAKIAILMGGKAIARYPNKGNIARAYIELVSITQEEISEADHAD